MSQLENFPCASSCKCGDFIRAACLSCLQHCRLMYVPLKEWVIVRMPQVYQQLC